MGKTKKNPLRLEAIIPTVLICALIGGYFYLFFDNNVRWAAEWVGTRVHGAEVNIRKIKSSVFGGYFRVYNVQVTNKENPKQNLIEIGSMRFELLWDALLRAKFVVNEASIEDIKIYSPRKRPGYIVLPSNEESQSMRLAEEAILDQSKKQFNDNILGDVAHILGGVDPSSQLTSIEDQLLSKQKVKELESEFKNKEIQWKQRLNALPNQETINQLNARFKKLKFNSKKPQEFVQDIKELELILKEADQQIKLVSTTASDLDRDLKTFDKEIKSIDDLAKQDLRDIEKRIKLPNLDIKDFSKDLFGKLFNDKLAPYKKYIDLAQTYMPPKKDSQKPEDKPLLVPKKRFTGQTLRFPITVSYPLFWLKKASINSKATEEGFSGDVMGSITDLTSNPVHIGRPTLVKFKADFPQQNIMGIEALVTLDHTTNKPVQSLIGTVKSYNAGAIKLADSQVFKFHLEKSTGSSEFSGQIKEGQVNVSIHNKFNQVNYLIDSKNKDVKEIFTAVVKDIPQVDLKARVTGPWKKLHWKITSNLGQALRSGIQGQIQARINKAREKIKAQIEGLISKEKEKLTQSFNKIKSDADLKVAAAKKDLENSKAKIQSEADKAKASAKNEQTKKVEQEGKKILNDLKKKLKF